MYCNKCGAELKPGKPFCSMCGNRVGYVEGAGQPQQGGGITDIYQNPAYKKKGSNKKFILGGGIAAVVVIAAILLLNITSVMAFFAKNFGSGESYAKIVGANAVMKYSDSIESVYSNYIDDIKDGKMYELSATLTGSQELMNFIKSSTMVDLGSINSISVESKPLRSDNALGNDIVFSVNDKKVLTTNFVIDNKNLYMLIPELSQSAISESLDTDISSHISNYDEMLEALPSSKSLTKMLTKYGDIAADNLFKDTKKDKTSITANGVTQKCTELEINITADALLNTAIEVVETAREDDELIDTLVSIAYVYSQDYGMDKNQLRSSLVEEMNSALDDLNQEKSSVNSDTRIVVRAYVDSSHNLIGFEIVDEYETLLTAKQAIDGGRFGFEMLIEDVGITGSGTEDGGKLTGTYNISGSLASFDVKDFDMDSLHKGELKGTISLALSEDLLSEIFGSSDASYFASLSPSLVLDLDCGKESKIGLSILSGGTNFVSMEVTSKLANPGAANIPANTVDSYDWEDTVDYGYIINTMRDLGIDENLVSELESSL